MYYFILSEHIDEDEYKKLIHLYSMLKNKQISLNEIKDNYIPRIDEKFIDWTINKATFFEFFIFLEFCEKNKIDFLNVEPILDFNVVVNDNKMILFRNNEKFVLTKKDFVIWLRNNFSNQLYEIFSNFTNIIIPDRKKSYRYDKMSVISLILEKTNYSKISDIYWDISILFLTNNEENINIINFLIKKYDKFIIKTIDSEMGKWVYSFDKNDPIFFNKIINFLNDYSTTRQPLYITPFFDIEIEYRIYYTYIDNKVKIYTWKIKNNNNLEDAFRKWKLEMYKELDVSFNYFEVDNFDKRNIDFVCEIIKLVWWKVWVLEFIKAKNNKLYLMEINHLWRLLTCNKKDIDNLSKFYMNIYQDLIK